LDGDIAVGVDRDMGNIRGIILIRHVVSDISRLDKVSFYVRGNGVGSRWLVSVSHWLSVNPTDCYRLHGHVQGFNLKEITRATLTGLVAGFPIFEPHEVVRAAHQQSLQQKQQGLAGIGCL